VARVFAGRPVATAAALVVLALASWALAGLLAWFTWDLTLNLPGRETLRGLGNMAQSTTLYDRDGQAVFTIFKEQRIEVPLDQVSPLLVRAVVAVEDQRFYEHRGIDLVRVLGAMLANLRSGRRAQGGSTITQQLARLSFLTRNKTFRRKLKEMVLATQIEHAFTKDQILELYLNKVYFGDGLYGVEAASRGYFAKPARELSADEAALLAGLIQSPSAYAPSSNLPRALTRRVTVLQAMRESGVIDQATFDRARTAKVVLTNGLQRDEPFGLYFKEAVRRELVDRFGWERVSEGGLRVFTTIDSALQQASERTLEAALARLEARPGYPHRSRQQLREEAERDAAYLQGAAIVLDTATAEVRVLIGGRSFGESRFNRVTQARRQPGSAFKPVIYAAAIEDGASPSTVLTGLDDPVLIPGGMWMPEDEHSSSGAMSLRSALRTSSNRAAVRLIRQIGIDRAMEMVERLRLGPLPAVPSIALGAGEVTLEALTAAYGAFAAGGVLRRPILVRRVEDSDGAVLFEDNGDPQQAMSEVTAYLVSSMLQDVINAGTGARARGLGFSLPAAGKTGTTNDYMDAWFVGFTPRVVTGVWVGFDQPEPIMDGAYAGEVAVPLWTELMKAAAAGHKSEWLARPEELVPATICRLSGQLATPACSTVEVTNDLGEVEVKSMAYTEFYRRGSAPSATCPLHQVELLPEAPVLPQVMPIVPR
jgi:penicillin-binding protein 1A